MANPSFTQVTFRGRKDDGTETGATWIATQGTDWTQRVNQNFRIRFMIDETASRSWTGLTWNLYYSLNGAAYAAAGAGTPVIFATSIHFADGDDCAIKLTGGSGTYLTDNNGMKETQGAVNSGAAGQRFEVEFCLQIDSTQVAMNDTINLRVYNGTAPIAAYTDTPIITVDTTRRSQQPAYIFPNVNITASQKAYISTEPKSAKHAFMKGGGNFAIRTAVIRFTAKTSTGTQDITSDQLGGLTPRLAIFFCHNFTQDVTIVSNGANSVGVTNGTEHWLNYNDVSSGSGDQRGYRTDACCGLYYGSKGYASFDSWISNGIRINWQVQANAAYYCQVLIIASNDADAVQSKIGSQTITNPNTNDTFDITTGFEPSFFLVNSSWNLPSVDECIGIASVDPDGVLHSCYRNIEYSWQGYIQWACGSVGGGEGEKTVLYSRTGLVDDPPAAPRYFDVESMLANGFRLKCITGNGTTDTTFYYLAVSLGHPWYVKDLAMTDYGAPYTFKFYPKAVLGFAGSASYSPYDLTHVVPGISNGMADANSQMSGCWWTHKGGSTWEVNNIGNLSTIADIYKWDTTPDEHVFAVTLGFSGYNLTFNNVVNYGSVLSLVVGIMPVKSNKHAYLRGGVPSSTKHSYLTGQVIADSSQTAYAHGQITASSSQDAYVEGEEEAGLQTSALSAFINGVSFPSSTKPAFLQGYIPADSSIPAFLLGIPEAKGSQNSYTFGIMLSFTGVGAYLNGLQRSRSAAFLLGILRTKSAFLKGRAVYWDSKPAFVTGSSPYSLFDIRNAYLRGGSSSQESSKPGYLFGNLRSQWRTSAFIHGMRSASSFCKAYTSAGFARSSTNAFMMVEGVLGGTMEYNYIILKTSDAGVTKTAKFRVLAEGYNDGEPEKAANAVRTVGGGLDVSMGAIYKSWNPIIRVRHTEDAAGIAAGYGTLADLEYFYGLNNPLATPSNKITFVDHHGVENVVMILGKLPKATMGCKIEGETAWFLLKVNLIKVQ